MKLEFEPLTANDVECRIGTIPKTGKGLSLLLYKDARCDMRQLDKAVGPMNWQRKHEFKNGLLYCSVGIYDEDKQQWIWKEDVGTESNTQKEKGQASDSFKRACTNWGIGRELYTAPFIWIPSDKVNIKGLNGKFTCSDKFMVTKMELDENRIIKDLVITKVSSYGKPGDVVYRMNNINGTKETQTQEKEETQSRAKKQQSTAKQELTQSQINRLYAIAGANSYDDRLIHKAIEKHYGKKHVKELTVKEYEHLCNNIEKNPIKTGTQQSMVNNYGQGNYSAGGYA